MAWADNLLAAIATDLVLSPEAPIMTTTSAAAAALADTMADPESKSGNGNLQHWREMTLRSA
jgi:hypothetical protein